MASSRTPLMLRLNPTLHKALKRAAKRNKSSLNEEISKRLRESFLLSWRDQLPKKMKKAFREIAEDFIDYVKPESINGSVPKRD